MSSRERVFSNATTAGISSNVIERAVKPSGRGVFITSPFLTNAGLSHYKGDRLAAKGSRKTELAENLNLKRIHHEEHEGHEEWNSIICRIG
jgi:hypothetical protein